jgi:NAD(P)-dependent dehydrogenase (short-subunit alcohol dehydrogenase family)
MKKVALVTGASSGIGLAVSRQLLALGYTVYGLSRRGTSAEGVLPLAAEVTDEEAVKAAVASVFEKEGQIDLLINNAGMGISGPIEFTEAEDMKRIMEVNFYGQVYCAKAVLLYMRQQGRGRIVCTSSVAAPIAIPYQSFYSCSKAAVSDMALALRNEVRAFGIEVCAVMPGDAKTGFTDARKKESKGNDIYTHNESAVAAMEKDERGGMTPDDVAAVIVKAATVKNPKPLFTAGAKYKVFVVLFKLLPYRLAYWIVGKMYS